MVGEDTKSGLTKASEILPLVIKNLGIEENVKLKMLKEVWSNINENKIAKNSTPGYIDKENNLVVYVSNAVLSTELSMQKITLLKKLKDNSKNIELEFKDIRFVPKTGM